MIVDVQKQNCTHLKFPMCFYFLLKRYSENALSQDLNFIQKYQQSIECFEVTKAKYLMYSKSICRASLWSQNYLILGMLTEIFKMVNSWL